MAAKNKQNNTDKKKAHHKLKTYLVMQHLLRNTDADHPVSAIDLCADLEVEYDIEAERRSIYRDIDEINEVHFMVENECKISEA